MYFKASGFVLQIAALLLNLTACNLKVGEQPPEPKNIEFAATKCFNQSVYDIKKFFEATADESRLAAAWSCLEASFAQFEKYVVGKDQDRYASQEIVTFIEDNFFEDTKKNKLTPELQKELMKLKPIFIGGDTDFITREELRSSQKFLQRISRMTVKLNPHMKVIMSKWKPELRTTRSQDLETFEAANTALQEFAIEMAELIIQNKSLYQLDDIVVLFREFEKFFDTNWDWVKDIENFVPGFKKLKMALSGGNENSVDQKEWGPVLTLGARGYFQFLRYEYFIKTTHETGGAIRLVYVARTLEDVFSIFQDLVSRKVTGVVTALEVYEVLHAFEQFWQELKVSENLITEIMKIKQVVIGGTVESWTVADFQQARLKVPELRRIIENFMPYFSIYVNEWDPDTEDPAKARKTFELARVQLKIAAQGLGRFFVGPYSYDDLILLVKEINALYPDIAYLNFSTKKSKTKEKIPGVFGNQISQFREVFIAAKSMIYNQSDTVVQKDQWPDVLTIGAQVYSLYQFQDYFLADKDWKKNQGVQDLGTFVDNSSNFIESLLKLSKKGYFTQGELITLTNAISEANVLGNKLKPETVQNLWKGLLQYILFPPEDRLAGRKNDKFDMEQINILKREFSIWNKSQIALNEIFANDPELSLEKNELLKKVKDKILENRHDPEFEMGLQGVFSLLDGPITFTMNAEDLLEISNRVNWKYKMNALFQANLTRALARLLMRSFSSEATLHRTNKCETQVAFDLLAGVFRDLRIFDPKENFINSRFLEANIFMSRSNGDKYLDYNELGELLNIIFSGIKINEKLKSSLRNECPVHKTQKNEEFVTFKCMSEHYYTKVREEMTQLPEFKAYLDKLARMDNSKQSSQSRTGFNTWNRVFRQTLKATGWKPNKGYGSVKNESVLFSESLYYPFIVQYTEFLYARFDTSKNGYLQAFEAKKAFPTFKTILKDLAKNELQDGTIKESDILAVFTYILYYKVKPSEDMAHKWYWIWWKDDPAKWDANVYAGRGDVVDILGMISDEADNGPGDNAPVCKKM